MGNFRNLVYQVNGRNAESIAEEFDFDEFEKDYILNTFWPIITLNEIDVDNIIAKTINIKEEFINYYKEFDIDIFKREYLDYSEYEIKEFQSVIKKGKYNVWDIKNGKHFYHLKLESERDTPRHQTLLITEKDEIQLELYFKKIIGFIESFTENHTIFNSKNTTQKIEKVKTKLQVVPHIQNKTVKIKLVSFFEYTSKYSKIMELLLEKKLVLAGNYYWIDTDKGSKTILVSLIKTLGAKGYFKKNNTPKNEEIKIICSETFGKSISIDTVKRAKIDSNFFSFIPLSTEIE